MTTTLLGHGVSARSDNLTNTDLHQEVVRQEGLARAHAVERLRLIAEVDRRGSYQDEGFVSTTSWLRHRCRMSGSEAKRWVELARRLAQLPEVMSTLAEGDISLDHARLLASASVDYPRQFAADGTFLIESARNLSPPDLRKALDYWRQAAAPDDVAAAFERRHQQRRVFVSTTLGGMVRIDGDLDPEGGAVVMTALRSLAEPAGLDAKDGRTSPQRRVDALVDICRDYLDSGAAQRAGGERPHITLTVDLATLESRAGKTCELDDSGVVSAETARRLACDAGLSRVITKGPSEPLDVGRRTRTIPASVRKALAVRDGGCIHDG